ncbi:MAG: class IV adenylate cyclase [Promethearchaeota archaeon]
MPSFEVEVKIPLESSESLHASLLDIGGRKLNTETQIDAYYDHPSRKFQDTDEAVRVRRRQPHPDFPGLTPSHDDPQYEMTYKGPRVDPLSKTRVELSVGVDDTASMESILEHLSFKKVAELVKTRSFYDVSGITVSIDDVVDVGLFLELERVVYDEAEIEPAREYIFEVVRKLGLDPSKAVRTSYLELYQQWTSA